MNQKAILLTLGERSYLQIAWQGFVTDSVEYFNGQHTLLGSQLIDDHNGLVELDLLIPTLLKLKLLRFWLCRFYIEDSQKFGPKRQFTFQDSQLITMEDDTTEVFLTSFEPLSNILDPQLGQSDASIDILKDIIDVERPVFITGSNVSIPIGEIHWQHHNAHSSHYEILLHIA